MDAVQGLLPDSRAAEICKPRSPLRKGHFVFHILREKRADNSEWGEALAATLEGTMPAREVYGFPSSLFTLYDL